MPIDMGVLPNQKGRNTTRLLDLAANLQYLGASSADLHLPNYRSHSGAIFQGKHQLHPKFLI